MNFETSKHAKYHSMNPVSRFFVKNFYSSISQICRNLNPVNRYIEVGCGEGYVSKIVTEIIKPTNCYAVDIDPNEAEDAKRNLPQCNVSVASIYELPFEDSHFDLIVCCEVLEHLEHPEKALAELKRISSGQIILSVPNEPLWRILNMARLKYLKDWGNTPGHLNHWSQSEFREMVSSHFRVKFTLSPTPWTMFLCEV